MEKEVNLPSHVAIIVDGNGRWATEKGLNRSKGHEAGFINLQKVATYIYSKNINYISAYLFSTENFKRSEAEINFLMNLLTGKLKEILEFCHQQKIHAIFSGRKEKLSNKVIQAMNKIEEETNKYQKRTFNICFNYGGRSEIIDATKKIVEDIKKNKLNLENLDEKTYSKYLYNNVPDVDLMIRTSGEKRISNFLLWQCSYAEFYFTDVYFPDFKEKEIDAALEEYKKRNRRFGGIKNETKNN